MVRGGGLRSGALAAVVGLMAFGTATVARATSGPAIYAGPVPDAPCHGPSDHPEAIQGRAPVADYADGRAALGYTCNATQLGRIGTTGGYRVYRYTDRAGRICAFFDSTLLFPANGATEPGQTGVWVLDMTNPDKPVHTATLSTPAMQSPHESLSLNVTRGLVGAVLGNPLFYPGQFDLYDVSADCTHPVLDASLPMGVLGHEGSFAPDGRTYYATSLFGHTLTAIDVSTPQLPRIVWSSANWSVHGLNLSNDGMTMYFADLGSAGTSPPVSHTGTDGSKGLTVLDVSQIQKRVANPQVRVIGHLTWPQVSTPQTDLPFTRGGHPYLAEVDEFGAGSGSKGPVGAARIIDISNPAAPKVVSNIRLAVNSQAAITGSEQKDPGASSSLQGYAAHYCGLPSRVDPDMLACSFIASGLRVFDIRDVAHPKEIAYFNKPELTGPGGGSSSGEYAMSQPAFDMLHHQIWYADGNTGFYSVQINPAVWPG